jgi:hypothetical protein
MEHILFSLAAWLFVVILLLVAGMAIVWLLLVLISSIESNSQYDILDSEHHDH